MKKKGVKTISCMLVLSLVIGVCINTFSLTVNDTSPTLTGIDKIDNLTGMHAYTGGIAITNWFNNCAYSTYNVDTIENGVTIFPYVEYKVKSGTQLKFNTYNMEFTKKFTVQESDTGTAWTDVTATAKSNVMADATWTQTLYRASISKTLVRIVFPDKKLNGNNYLLDYVEAIDPAKAALFGMDDYFMSTVKFSDKTYSTSSNLLIDNIAWNPSLLDVIFPNSAASYNENGIKHNGYLAYKVNIGDTFVAQAYEFQDNYPVMSRTFNWTFQTSQDGIAWTDITATRTSKGQLGQLSGTTKRPFEVVDFKIDAVPSNFIRIVFPTPDYTGSIHRVAAGPADLNGIKLNSSATAFSGIDEFADLSKIFYNTFNVKTDGNDLQNDENLAYFNDFTTLERKSGWVAYKIEKGSSFSFKTQYKHGDIPAGVDQYKLESTTDGINWTNIPLTISEASYDGSYWNFSTFSANDIQSEYVRIKFPEGFFSWQALIKSVTVVKGDTGYTINTSAAAYNGLDEFTTLNNIAGKSMNIVLEGTGFIMPDSTKTYFENHKRDAGFVAYRINPGNDIIFKVRNGDRDAGKEWIIEKSNDTKTWTAVPATKTIGETLDNYWTKITYEADSVDAKYIRIRFPDGIYDWRSLLDSVGVRQHYVPGPIFTIDANAKKFRGADSCSTKTKAFSYSNNVIVNAGLFLTQNEKITYYEKGFKSNGYVAYKINRNDTVVFNVRNGDRAVNWEWVLEGTNDGTTWTKIDLQKTVAPKIIDNYWALISYRANNVAFDYIRIRFPQDIYDWRTLLDSVVIDVNSQNKPLIDVKSSRGNFTGYDELDTLNNLAGMSKNIKLEYSIIYQNENIVNIENFALAPGFIAYKINKGSYIKFKTADADYQDLTYTAQGSNDGISWTEIPLSFVSEKGIWADKVMNKVYVSQAVNFSYVRIIFPWNASSWKSKIDNVEVSSSKLSLETKILPIVKSLPANFGNITPDENASALEGLDGLSSLQNIFSVGPNIKRDIGALSMDGSIAGVVADREPYIAYEIPYGSKVDILTAFADTGIGNDSNFVIELSNDGKIWNVTKYTKTMDKLVDKFWQYLKLTVDKANGKYLRIRFPKSTVGWKIRTTQITLTGGIKSPTALSGTVVLDKLSNTFDCSNNVTTFVDKIGGIARSETVSLPSYVVYKVKKGNVFCVQTQDGDLELDADWQFMTSNDGINWKKPVTTMERKPEDIIAKYWVYSKFYIAKLDAEYVKIVFPSIAFSGKDMIIKVVSAPTKQKIDLLFSGGYAETVNPPKEVIRLAKANIYNPANPNGDSKDNTKGISPLIIAAIALGAVLLAGALAFILGRRKKKLATTNVQGVK